MFRCISFRYAGTSHWCWLRHADIFAMLSFAIFADWLVFFLRFRWLFAFADFCFRFLFIILLLLICHSWFIISSPWLRRWLRRCAFIYCWCFAIFSYDMFIDYFFSCYFDFRLSITLFRSIFTFDLFSPLMLFITLSLFRRFRHFRQRFFDFLLPRFIIDYFHCWFFFRHAYFLRYWAPFHLPFIFAFDAIFRRCCCFLRRHCFAFCFRRASSSLLRVTLRDIADTLSLFISPLLLLCYYIRYYWLLLLIISLPLIAPCFIVDDIADIFFEAFFHISSLCFDDYGGWLLISSLDATHDAI